MSYGHRSKEKDYGEYKRLLEKMGKPKEWVTADNSKKLVSEVCDPFGKDLRDEGLKTSQIRKFLNEVQALSITPQVEKLPFLKAKLAYAAGRKRELTGFYDVVSYAIDQVGDVEDIRGFKEFLLGTVAYHKYYGGRE